MIRVLVVDDSLFMRNTLSDALGKVSDIEVVGALSSGEEALLQLATLRPDVITLDHEMPGLDGVATLRRIMRRQPTPVVMVSSHTTKGGEVTLKALHEGAVDYVLKPSEQSMNMEAFSTQLINRVRVASSVNLDALKKTIALEINRLELESPFTLSDRAIVIGSSTGGTYVVEAILAALPKGFPCPVFVVQHMSGFFTASFAERLNARSALLVKEAQEGEDVQSGVVYVAPGDFNMALELGVSPAHTEKAQHVQVRLTKHCDPSTYCPSIDILMHSVARLYAKHAVGVLLSGIGEDGSGGVNQISLVGGHIMVQDKKTSIIYGMAQAAVKEGAVDEEVPAERIAERLVELVS
jgi:two-component system, chemotaxis family, protein-glutamate methylesterase/glutaminase